MLQQEQDTKKKLLKEQKDITAEEKNVFRVAVQAVERGMQYAYRDRIKEKAILVDFGYRELMQEFELHGLTYSQFISGSKILY